jgi:hypothetical protein
MADTFSLDLVNPAIEGGPANVIDTNVAGGNKLNLVLTNNFGFDLTFGAEGSSNPLLVKISKNIIDDKNFGLITVAAPWTTDGFYTPDQDPDPLDDKNYYVLKLKPPSEGILFKDGGSIIVGLENLLPAVKGSATVFAEYVFELTTMNSTRQLAVLGSDKPGNKPLIGDTNALRFTLRVNDDGPTNRIVVTEKPVTEANAAENKLHLNFDFQDLNMPPIHQEMLDAMADPPKTLGQLVPGWDAKTPPTFRVQFPYFDARSPFPAPIDLTDDLKPKAGENDYNEYTSAWNIKLSLDAENPDIVSNTWWTIKLDPESPSPSWIIQPTPANKYLFTGTTSGPTGAGPFLDLFFSHIYSALPIDTSRPETFIYLETYDFPGFNDRLLNQPLFKEQSVQITCFTGAVNFIAGGTAQLVLNWETKNAFECYVSGDSNKQNPNSQDNAYSRDINVTKPLMSSYTLKAVGKNSVSVIRKSINIQWKQSAGPLSPAIASPTGIDISPDGTKVYIAGTADAEFPPQLIILDGKTLVNTNQSITLPGGNAVKNVKASADGSKLFIAGLPDSGDTGFLYGYTTATKPNQLPGSPASPGFNGSVNLYPMAISDDDTQVIVSAPRADTAPFIAGYNVSDLTPSTGSPATVPGLGQIGLAIHGNNVFYPDSQGLGVMDRTTLTPVKGSPISLKSNDNITYKPGALAVSPDGKTVTTLAYGFIDAQRAFILCQVDIASMSLKKRVQVYNGYPNAYPTPTTGLQYSQDGMYIIVFGINFTKSPSDKQETLFSVFDAASLQEFSAWSPVPVTKFFVDMVMAPDGSRIYVSTLDSANSSLGKVLEMIPYFASVKCSETFLPSEL